MISVAALGVACVTDLRARRIPNQLNGTLALGLLALHVHGAGLTGLLDALIALVICFGVGLVMYLLGALGAGDVKLMAALSLALDGTSALSFLARIALAGGLLGVTRLIADGNLRNALFGLLSSARRAEADAQRLHHRHRGQLAAVGGGRHDGRLRAAHRRRWRHRFDTAGLPLLPSMMIVRISLVLAAFVGASSASAATVRVAVGQQRVVERSNISKVAIGNPKIADVRALSQRQLLVTGVSVGRTSLTIFSPAGSEQLNVHVTPQDLQASEREVGRLIRGLPKVRVREIGDRLVLQGEVRSVKEHRVELVRDMHPSVINMVTIAESTKAEIADGLTQRFRRHAIARRGGSGHAVR